MGEWVLRPLTVTFDLAPGERVVADVAPDTPPPSGQYHHLKLVSSSSSSSSKQVCQFKYIIANLGVHLKQATALSLLTIISLITETYTPQVKL